MLVGITVSKKNALEENIFILYKDNKEDGYIEYAYYTHKNQTKEYYAYYSSIEKWRESSGIFEYFEISDRPIPNNRKEVIDLIMELIPEVCL